MALPPEAYLEKLIERVGCQVGGIAPNSLRGGSEAMLNNQGQVREKGHGHLVEALRRARAALASGDTKQIAAAVPYCLALERTGRELQAKLAAREAELAGCEAARRRRSKGGKTAGAASSAKAAAAWAPYVKQFRQLVEKGHKPATARGIVSRRMEAEGFVNNASGSTYSGKTIAGRLK